MLETVWIQIVFRLLKRSIFLFILYSCMTPLCELGRKVTLGVFSHEKSLWEHLSVLRAQDYFILTGPIIFFLNQSTVSQELSELLPSLILSKDLSLFFRNAEFFYLLHPQSTPHFTHLLKYLLIIKWIFIWINMYINIFLVVQDNMQK